MRGPSTPRRPRPETDSAPAHQLRPVPDRAGPAGPGDEPRPGRRPTRTRTSSWTSPTRWSSWSPPSCPPRAPTSGSTRSPRGLFARYPERRRVRRRGPGRARGDDQADRVLPGQDRHADQARAPRSSSGSTGEVPNTLDELVTLPGVGRKTANVVLGNAFGVPGITVDTHFGRLVRRFGWTAETDPDKVELAVGALFPPPGLDPALPQRDLARPSPLPRPQPGLRRMPGGPLVPVVRRGRDQPGQGGQAGPRAARMRDGPRLASWRSPALVLLAALLALRRTGRPPPIEAPVADRRRLSDLAALEAGGRDRGLPALRSRRRRGHRRTARRGAGLSRRGPRGPAGRASGPADDDQRLGPVVRPCREEAPFISEVADANEPT